MLGLKLNHVSRCGLVYLQNNNIDNRTCRPVSIILYTDTITVTTKWARLRLKSPASSLFTQPFVQAQVKENIIAPCHWPVWGEFTGDRWIPRPRKMFPCDDISKTLALIRSLYVLNKFILILEQNQPVWSCCRDNVRCPWPGEGISQSTAAKTSKGGIIAHKYWFELMLFQ